MATHHRVYTAAAPPPPPGNRYFTGRMGNYVPPTSHNLRSPDSFLQQDCRAELLNKIHVQGTDSEVHNQSSICACMGNLARRIFPSDSEVLIFSILYISSSSPSAALRSLQLSDPGGPGMCKSRFPGCHMVECTDRRSLRTLVPGPEEEPEASEVDGRRTLFVPRATEVHLIAVEVKP